MPTTMQRREWLGSAMAVAASAGAKTIPIRLAHFRADVTPPVGHPILTGIPTRSVVDPLFAMGVALVPDGQRPIVLVAVDWCEIRNEAYERWRAELAKAARTTRERVIVSCVHQHDAPYVDTGAQQLLDEHRVTGGRMCDERVNEQAIAKVAAALAASLGSARAVTHVGTGQAKVVDVASNRRYVMPNGKVSFGRTSATRDPAIRNMPEGLIDPWLKTISFWDGDTPVAALSCYATHPMSYYGKGDISADFVGMARARRQQETPQVAQIYLSGCAGDTMAGRYNDGDPANRPVLAGRVHRGMVEAWQATERKPLGRVGFRNVKMRMKPRATKGFSLPELRATLADTSLAYRYRADAALALSWRKRYDAGHAIDVPAVDLGGHAQIVLMPAEAFVQYQLWAQELRPGSMVMTPAYGECAPGYIPTAAAAAEGYDDYYSWIAFPECEATMRGALRAALAK